MLLCSMMWCLFVLFLCCFSVCEWCVWVASLGTVLWMSEHIKAGNVVGMIVRLDDWLCLSLWCFAVCLLVCASHYLLLKSECAKGFANNWKLWFVFNCVLKFRWWCVVLCVSYCLLYARAYGQQLEMISRWWVILCSAVSFVFLYTWTTGQKLEIIIVCDDVCYCCWLICVPCCFLYVRTDGQRVDMMICLCFVVVCRFFVFFVSVYVNGRPTPGHCNLWTVFDACFVVPLHSLLFLYARADCQTNLK